MRLLGFLTGFSLIAAALFFSDLTPVRTESSMTTAPAQPENNHSLNLPSDPLEFFESDRSKNQPNGKKELPVPGVLPIAEPTQDMMPESTKSIQAISTALTTPTEKENETDADEPTVRTAQISQTANLQTSDNTKKVSRSLVPASKWKPFWGPFNTPGSAKSFAKAVAEKTGLDIRVVKTRQGRYMIMYSYSSEDERQSSILLLEQRTGLRINPQ